MLESIKDYIWPAKTETNLFKPIDPYFLSEDEILSLIAENLKGHWKLSYKEFPSCNSSPSLVVWLPMSGCIAHTTFGINQIMIHKRDWEIPGYNTDLHVTLHEIAHAKRQVYTLDEVHGMRWEKDFLTLCAKYGFLPQRKHMASNGFPNEFF